MICLTIMGMSSFFPLFLLLLLPLLFLLLLLLFLGKEGGVRPPLGLEAWGTCPMCPLGNASLQTAQYYTHLFSSLWFLVGMEANRSISLQIH